MAYIRLLLMTLAFTACGPAALALVQSAPVLHLDRPITTTISPGEAKAFTLTLREGDLAEVFWLANDELNLRVVVRGPDGAEVPSGPEDLDNSLAFVAPAAGDYRVSVNLGESQELTGPQQVTLRYRDKPQLPAGVPKLTRRSVNGYDVKIRVWDEEGRSVLTVEKLGRARLFMRGVGGIGGFQFMDDPAQAYDARERHSATLVKATPDKTDDGTPDVAVSYYSGGAHCCSTVYFIELGERVRVAAEVAGGNVPVLAVGRAAGGGLRLETGDNTFAYWLTSFAESPIPTIIYEFRGGELRPTPDAMRKPAPSLQKLQQEARAVRARLSLEPYTGEAESGFGVAFWGRMLDLIYSGHEALAWQYLDLAWPIKKPGKALFRADFERLLSKSPFWSMATKR